MGMFSWTVSLLMTAYDYDCIASSICSYAYLWVLITHTNLSTCLVRVTHLLVWRIGIVIFCLNTYLIHWIDNLIRYFTIQLSEPYTSTPEDLWVFNKYNEDKIAIVRDRNLYMEALCYSFSVFHSQDTQIHWKKKPDFTISYLGTLVLRVACMKLIYSFSLYYSLATSMWGVYHSI